MEDGIGGAPPTQPASDREIETGTPESPSTACWYRNQSLASYPARGLFRLIQ